MINGGGSARATPADGPAAAPNSAAKSVLAAKRGNQGILRGTPANLPPRPSGDKDFLLRKKLAHP